MNINKVVAYITAFVCIGGLLFISAYPFIFHEPIYAHLPGWLQVWFERR